MQRHRFEWGEGAFVDRGSGGQALVLLHGTGCDSGDWEPLLEHLPDLSRVIQVDFRGHGESSVSSCRFTLSDLANDVLVLMEAQGVREAVLGGHSLGGMVAMEAARHSAAIRSLVLFEGWTRLGTVSAFDCSRHMYGTFSPDVVSVIRAKSEATRARIGRDIFDDFWKSVESFDAADFLKATGLPIVEVFGDCGRLPDTEGRLAVPARPNIQIEWVETAGHYLTVERPRECAKCCRQALLAAGFVAG